MGNQINLEITKNKMLLARRKQSRLRKCCSGNCPRKGELHILFSKGFNSFPLVKEEVFFEVTTGNIRCLYMYSELII